VGEHVLPETFQCTKYKRVRVSFFLLHRRQNLTRSAIQLSTWLSRHAKRDSVGIRSMAGPLETLLGLYYCNKLLLRSAQLVSCIVYRLQCASSLGGVPQNFGWHIRSRHCCLYCSSQFNFFHIGQHGDKDSKKMSTVSLEVWVYRSCFVVGWWRHR
jgi:hypothetical protein